MIEPLLYPPPRVSLFESVLARWLVALASRQYSIDVFPPRESPATPPVPEVAPAAVAGE